MKLKMNEIISNSQKEVFPDLSLLFTFTVVLQSVVAYLRLKIKENREGIVTQIAESTLSLNAVKEWWRAGWFRSAPTRRYR